MEEHERTGTTDPDGRAVVFDAGSRLHLALGRRTWLLEHIETMLATVARPDYRDDDPRPGGERFYRRHAFEPKRWLRVVVDFSSEPAWIVTALVQDHDPREQRR